MTVGTDFNYFPNSGCLELGEMSPTLANKGRLKFYLISAFVLKLVSEELKSHSFGDYNSRWKRCLVSLPLSALER